MGFPAAGTAGLFCSVPPSLLCWGLWQVLVGPCLPGHGCPKPWLKHFLALFQAESHGHGPPGASAWSPEPCLGLILPGPELPGGCGVQSAAGSLLRLVVSCLLGPVMPPWGQCHAACPCQPCALASMWAGSDPFLLPPSTSVCFPDTFQVHANLVLPVGLVWALVAPSVQPQVCWGLWRGCRGSLFCSPPWLFPYPIDLHSPSHPPAAWAHAPCQAQSEVHGALALSVSFALVPDHWHGPPRAISST